jgi:outer membrane protein
MKNKKRMRHHSKYKFISTAGLTLLLIFSAFDRSTAQSTLTINEALKIALQNNYEITIASNASLINKTNNTLGNSGFLPTVSLNAADNFALNNIDQQINSTNGVNKIAKNGATNIALNASIGLNWTVYDGGKMFITKQKLNHIEAQGELALRAQVQQTVLEVVKAYYNVVQLKQQLLSVNEVIAYNTERVKILQTINNNGLSPKNLLLQAKIDLNVYKENSIKQISTIKAAKRALNQILAIASETDFDVPDTIPCNFTPDKAQLLNKLESNNLDLLALQKKQEINLSTIKELEAGKYPIVNLNGSYGLSQIKNSAGNLLQNNSNGLQIGASITVPLYQGGNIERQVKLAKIQYKAGNLLLEQTKLNLSSQLQSALDQYQIQSDLLKIEIENEALAKENLTISIERLRYGQTNSLELRQAQESFVESETRRINFNYNLKLAEASIKQMIGEF